MAQQTTFPQFAQLPAKIRDAVFEAACERLLFTPRFLDTRLREQFSPIALAHVSIQARATVLRSLGARVPGPTGLSLQAGLQIRNMNPRWILQDDMLLVDVDCWSFQQLVLDANHNVGTLGLLVDSQSRLNWGNILLAILPDPLRGEMKIKLVYELNDHVWTTKDLDNSIYLAEADFKADFRGVCKGVDGISSIGHIFLQGNDITTQVEAWIQAVQTDLDRWITGYTGNPQASTDVLCVFSPGTKERLVARKAIAHPRYENLDF